MTAKEVEQTVTMLVLRYGSVKVAFKRWLAEDRADFSDNENELFGELYQSYKDAKLESFISDD